MQTQGLRPHTPNTNDGGDWRMGADCIGGPPTLTLSQRERGSDHGAGGVAVVGVCGDDRG